VRLEDEDEEEEEAWAGMETVRHMGRIAAREEMGKLGLMGGWVGVGEVGGEVEAEVEMDSR